MADMDEQAERAAEGSGVMFRVLQLEAVVSSLKELVYKLDLGAAQRNQADLAHLKDGQERLVVDVKKLRACVDDTERQLGELKRFVDDHSQADEAAKAFWRKTRDDIASGLIKALVYALLGLLGLGALYKLGGALDVLK